jgi:hypothetical protein
MDYCQATQPDNKQPTCLICHTDYIEESPEKSLIKIIDCSHIYHTVCIEEWFKYNESCPLCRRQLGVTTREGPNLLQYILLFLSLQYAPQENDESLYAYGSYTLSNTAFTCVFLSILLERYKTAAEYNAMKNNITTFKTSMCINGEYLPADVNISSRTAIVREIKQRQILLRSQLIQWIWTEIDAHHLSDPPELPHGRELYSHPYLQAWKRQIESALDSMPII